jgi:HEAT repeat protein
MAGVFVYTPPKSCLKLGRHARLVLLAACWGALALGVSQPVCAQTWVSALSELRLAPLDLRDMRHPLAQRVALARALGSFGSDADAVPTLLEALEGKPEPVLRQEILLALARRAPPDAAPKLVALLEHEETPPAELGTALAAIATPEALAALTDALARPKQAAIAERALLDAGAQAAIPLARAVTSAIALRATRLLGKLGAGAAPHALGALTSALSSESPQLRAAAAEALGRMGEAASTRAGAVLQKLDDPSPAVVSAALTALEQLATPQQAPALAKFFARTDPALRPLALSALVAADPARALTQLEGALYGRDQTLRAAALAALESARPDASFAPLLARCFDAELRESTASALARLPEGAGMPALLAAASRSPEAARHASRAIAIALRRFGADLDGEVTRQAQQVLRGLPQGERRLLLLALARDPVAQREAIAALAAKDAGMRATAAAALAAFGDAEAGRTLLAALANERELEAKRSMLQAAAALQLDVPNALIERMLADAETAPEAMQLCRVYPGTAAPKELRVALRRALSVTNAPRARVAAALALGQVGDSAARPVLELALGESSARLRLAAVRALAALGGSKIALALRRHARIERDPLVRRATIEMVAHAGVPAALRERGSLALEVRVRAERGAAQLRPRLEVLLEDGRWLRVRALPGGELIVPDLPPGEAEVRVVD